MAEITLYKYRRGRNLTLEEVSGRTGVSRAEVNKIENNRVSPTLDTLEKIAAGLECKIEDLYYSDYK